MARLRKYLSAWKRLQGWLRHRETSLPSHTRGPVTHVVILDGTASSLKRGFETNAGLTYRLLARAGRRAHLSLYYEAGIQWNGWRTTGDVIVGRGLNRQIERAYGFLASRYRPGDKIFLLGYSRGAFAVRSLAGAIDRVGLVEARHATVRNIRQAYRHYRYTPDSDACRAFKKAFCLGDVPIEMLGVWDTVRALGMRAPLLWTLSEPRHRFHNLRLASHVRRGFQALGANETRMAFAPVLWTTGTNGGAMRGPFVEAEDDADPAMMQEIEQRWFRGTHGDVGGQIDGKDEVRPLSNVSLVWMLEQAEAAGLPMPDDWQDRFPQDPAAPSIGTMRGWGKIFWFRKRRVMGRDPSETFHTGVVPPKGWVMPRPDKGVAAEPDAQAAEIPSQ